MKVRPEFQPFAQRASRSGTVLIFALVVLAVAAVGMAGWVYLMGALAEHTAGARDAAERRLKLENSRALAMQYLRENVLPGTTTNGISGSISWSGYDLGALTLSSASSEPMISTGQPSGENPFSPAGNTEYVQSGTTYLFRGYSTSITGTLGDDDIPWAFAARSRTPTFGYDVLALNPGGSATGYAAGSTAAIGSLNGPTVGGVLLNVAFPPTITGPSDFISDDDSEEIDPTVVISDDSEKTVDYTCDPAGSVTIYLKRNSAQKKYYITGDLQTLTFSNDAATDPGALVSDWSPIRVICDTTSLATVAFPDGSLRRLYLAIDNHGVPVQFGAAGMSDLRLAGFLQNTQVTFALTGNLNITGGLQTDSGITFSGGTATFLRETAPHGQLERLGSRRAWVEAHRND